MTKEHRTILVVDDETAFCSLFRRHFERINYLVLVAGDGEEALAVYQQNRAQIELVITDIRMPRMSGDVLIRELRERDSALPIIGITGHEELKERLAEHDSGAYYYVAKPIEDLILLEPIVRNAIRVFDYENLIRSQRDKEHRIARLLRAYLLRGPVRVKPRLQIEIAVESIERASATGKSLPSGDYAEWFERSGDEVVFYLADASGHDDIVASFSICLSNMVLHRCHHGGSPTVAEIISFVEDSFDGLRASGVWEDSRFFSFFVGCIDRLTGRLSYVSAGHPEAFLLRGNGVGEEMVVVERLRPTCSLIGYNSRFDFPIEIKETTVRHGDLIFLYSDGATEQLEDASSKQSGTDRLAAMVERTASRVPQEVVSAVKDRLFVALRDRGFMDDTTLMAVAVEGLG